MTLDARSGKIIGAKLLESWPEIRRCNLLGLGADARFCLESLRCLSARTIILCTETQKAQAWPKGRGNLLATGNLTALPFSDHAFDRVVFAFDTMTKPILREIWRVLAEDGRMIALVPVHFQNIKRTENLMRDSLFVPVQTKAALYVPQTLSCMAKDWAEKIEKKIPKKMPIALARLALIEAEKQIYAATPQEEKERSSLFHTRQNTSSAAGSACD